jgi:hypothetical protein
MLAAYNVRVIALMEAAGISETSVNFRIYGATFQKMSSSALRRENCKSHSKGNDFPICTKPLPLSSLPLSLSYFYLL